MDPVVVGALEQQLDRLVAGRLADEIQIPVAAAEFIIRDVTALGDVLSAEDLAVSFEAIPATGLQGRGVGETIARRVPTKGSSRSNGNASVSFTLWPRGRCRRSRGGETPGLVKRNARFVIPVALG
mgnify:CR=1 FL=1